jgi:hypothetical protein
LPACLGSIALKCFKLRPLVLSWPRCRDVRARGMPQERKYRKTPSSHQFAKTLLALAVDYSGDGSLGWFALVNPHAALLLDKSFGAHRSQHNLVTFKFELKLNVASRPIATIAGYCAIKDPARWALSSLKPAKPSTARRQYPPDCRLPG